MPRLYRTKDLVLLTSGAQGDGVVYLGCCNVMVQVMGEWVDTTELEQRLQDVDVVMKAVVCGGKAFVSIPRLNMDNAS